MTKVPSACGDPTRSERKRLILALNGSCCSTEELSNIKPMTDLLVRIESRSIVSMRWRTWKNFILTADFLGRDLGCGASMVPPEFLLNKLRELVIKGMPSSTALSNK